jgi:aspartyl-tRNA(Asn)/glutamyl-tRNA(Gln) amidotransferase subunit A
MDISALTIKEARQKLTNKEFSSVELTKAYLERIEKYDSTINSFVTVTKEVALVNAKTADKRIAEGEDLPLLGIPIAIKDNFCTKGIRTTASSRVLDNYIPPYDATVITKLKNAGMVMMGKTNMDAWAHGSSTETSDYGATRNPWDTNRLPGGSSGGSAAAVAARFATAAIGSETAGSIRQPASWCGIVGLKPTYGRVSRSGVVAMASSLDSPGPLSKTVEDATIILQVLAGKDPLDATTSPVPVPNYLNSLSKDIKGMVIGISDQYFFDGMEEEVKTSVEKAIKVFEKLGATIKKIPLFDPKYAIAVYTILQRSEVSSNLARYDGIRYGNDRSYFGAEAKRRVMLGTYALSAGYYDAFYKKAQQVRTLIVKDFEKAFNTVDVIISPTSPSVAMKIGASEQSSMFGELADVLVEPSSIAGLPGINITCGFTKAGLPVGMQIMGPQLAEERIISVAHAYEKANPLFKLMPEL